MVWSNWRGAVVVMFAWVGLAWSQAPQLTSTEGTGERIMTVHENGKSLRCRVLSTWYMAEGSKAYQLQTLDTGEMITIVEDGQGITLQEPLLGGKVRSLPMRIFHWGSSRTAPQGVPAPPDIIYTSTAPKVERTGYQQIDPMGSQPVSTQPIGKNETIWWEEKNSQRVSPKIVTGGNNPFEQQTKVVTTSGTRSKMPVIVEQNGNPATGPNYQIVPTTPGETTIVEAPEKSQRLFPKIFNNPRPISQVETASSTPYVQTGPTLLPNIVSASALTQPRVITPNLNTPGTVVQAGASAEPNPFPKTQTPYVQVGATALPNKAAPTVITQGLNIATPPQPAPNKIAPAEITQASNLAAPTTNSSTMTIPTEITQPTTATPIPTVPSKTEPAEIIQASETQNPTQDPVEDTPTAPPVAVEPAPAPQVVAQAPVPPPPPYTPPIIPSAPPAPASQPEALKTQAPIYQSGLTPLGNSTAAQAPTLPTLTKDSAPTTAETAGSTKPPAPPIANAPKSAKPTVLEKVQNWMNPKKDTAAVKPADTKAKQSAALEKPKTNGDVPVAPKTAADSIPFSTAADPYGNVKTPPAPTANENAAATSAPLPQTGLPITPGQTPDKGLSNPPAAQAAPKKDWRTMWGQPKDTKAQVPGQSMVNQATAKPDPNTVPLQPPASRTDAKTADILLNPEKFDPSGARLTPKGIHMNSYRGDPAQLMSKPPVAKVEQGAAQNEAASNQTFPPTPILPPPPPGNDGSMPPGTQSVLAAGANTPGQPPYVPVPMAIVPETFSPPAPKLPESPPTSTYANTFAPPPPPSTQEQNPLINKAISNMVPQPNLASQPNMNPQPNPTQTAPRYPQVPTNVPNFPPVSYQPNPTAQGYPVVPGYPPNPNTMLTQGMPNPYYYAPQGGPLQQQTGPLSVQGQTVAQTKYPQNYQSPPTQVQATQFTPAPAIQPQVKPDLERRVVPGTQSQDPSQVMQVLRESPYPAQREWASNTLGTFDWRGHPEIVQVLLLVAQQDPAATVRASCIYSLGRMNAASEPVLSILSTLRNDGDPRVRQEVEQALIRLGANKQQ